VSDPGRARQGSNLRPSANQRLLPTAGNLPAAIRLMAPHHSSCPQALTRYPQALTPVASQLPLHFAHPHKCSFQWRSRSSLTSDRLRGLHGRPHFGRACLVRAGWGSVRECLAGDNRLTAARHLTHPRSETRVRVTRWWKAARPPAQSAVRLSANCADHLADVRDRHR